ncbi:MAG: flagellar motor switch protein FliN [Nitrospinae bacterium]|nr:flagellar motor switch protein FliN [Nitrospinota bacterium]
MGTEEIGNEDDLWAAAEDELEQQRKMLRDASDKGAAAPAAAESAKGGGAPSAVKEAGDPKLDMILDIPLSLSVELGRAKMLINDLLQLGQGSVIELTKLVGEPLDVMVNNKLVARGEVVVVNNEKFGVKLSEVLSPLERIEKLG